MWLWVFVGLWVRLASDLGGLSRMRVSVSDGKYNECECRGEGNLSELDVGVSGSGDKLGK